MHNSIYFAGDLFDHKHLTGNRILAQQINKQSNEKYVCNLPQDFEQTVGRSVQIRNQDIKMVLEADLALFNFDGTDLDSGTVVEFMIAKMLDIPSVLLRTDLRNGGDAKDSDPWNLMCSSYPRTNILLINSMLLYKKHFSSTFSTENFYADLSQQIITSLDSVQSVKPVLNKKEALVLYTHLNKIIGEDFHIPESHIKEIVNGKVAKGLINK